MRDYSAYLPCCVALLSLLGCERSDKPSEPSNSNGTALTQGSAAAPALSTTRLPLRPLQVDEPEGLKAQPLLAVFQSSVWANPMGEEVPAFVLYRDGSVLTALGAQQPSGRISGQLSDAKAFSEQAYAALLSTEERTRLRQATDQPTVVFLARGKDGWIQRTVYAMLSTCEPSGAAPHAAALPIPPGIRSVCEQIQGANIAQPKAWVASEVEVTLWPATPSKVLPKPWPSALPPPPAEATSKLGTLIYAMDAKHLPELQAFLDSLENTQAVSVGGHNWSMSQRPIHPAAAHLRRVRQETSPR